jgi:hypothetical protein
MSGELDLIRAFRAEDAVVDASSQENARGALLEYIAASTNSTPRKRWGWLRRRSRPVAVLLVALVIAGAGGAAVLSLSSSQPLVGEGAGSDYPCLARGLRLHDQSDPRRYRSAGRGVGMGVMDRVQEGQQRLWRDETGDLRRLSNGHAPHLRRG